MAPDGLSRRRGARAGVRRRLRGRRRRAWPRRAAGRGAAGIEGAAGLRRALLAGLPAGGADQGRHRLHRDLRRRRGGLRAVAAAATGFARGRRARPSTPGPTPSTSWAGGSTPTGLGVILARALPPFVRREIRPAMETHAGAAGPGPRGRRPLHLPPGRHEGDRGHRRRVRPGAGRAGPRARGAGRPRQHVLADRAVHPRPRAARAACRGARCSPPWARASPPAR